MQAILYLWKKTFKNKIKDLKKHPGKLVGYLFIIGMIGLCFWSSTLNEKGDELRKVRSISELGVIIFVFFAFVFITSLFQSLASGSTIFRMPDVNFMFVSPISKRIVLLYGLVKQLGVSLLLSFFILFQTATLKDFYGVELGGVLVLFVGYYFLVISSSIVSMAIYAVTSGNEKRKKIVKIGIYALFIPMIISVLLAIYKDGITLTSIVEGVNSGINEWIPFVGWIKGIIFALITGNHSNMMFYVVLTVLSLAGVMIIIFRSNNNYYEDVLVATETLATKMEDAKAGKTSMSSSNRKIKVKATGINNGSGAITFFYKHVLEGRRARRFVVDNLTLIQVVVAVIAAFISKEVDNILVVFGITVYIQMFLSFADKWTEELTKPYVYMMPDSAFKKLLSIVSNGLIKTFIDGVLIFVIAGVILKAGIVEIAVCILARVGFGILFIAGDVLATRIFGVIKGNTLLSMLGFLITIVVAAPGIVMAVIVGMRFNSSLAGLLVTFICNIVISLFIVFFCRNLLANIEQNL